MAAKLGFLESTSVHIVNGRTVCLEAKKIRERNLTTSNNFDVILDMFFDSFLTIYLMTVLWKTPFKAVSIQFCYYKRLEISRYYYQMALISILYSCKHSSPTLV